ncbi:hypothetical protein Snas_5683 [Stackebrandtia nassauensis DSM 44728]|uniref:Uncharacterized protein n=1 Tax=Stackebrandtia nassauensis (strain DSM 44728 / CIP 108903 / NRRL B-16338 / NBRC 102104 / LLR-40K-21) TaxID=446470 RepID=D3PXY4_STANL|nr:hypothetical protein Snas_5683 [Stackebrandtia nassauensis DSM 44728]
MARGPFQWRLTSGAGRRDAGGHHTGFGGPGDRLGWVAPSAVPPSSGYIAGCGGGRVADDARAANTSSAAPTALTSPTTVSVTEIVLSPVMATRDRTPSPVSRESTNPPVRLVGVPGADVSRREPKPHNGSGGSGVCGSGLTGRQRGATPATRSMSAHARARPNSVSRSRGQSPQREPPASRSTIAARPSSRATSKPKQRPRGQGWQREPPARRSTTAARPSSRAVSPSTRSRGRRRQLAAGASRATARPLPAPVARRRGREPPPGPAGSRLRAAAACRAGAVTLRRDI